jgi:hypothetical protein
MMISLHVFESILERRRIGILFAFHSDGLLVSKPVFLKLCATKKGRQHITEEVQSMSDRMPLPRVGEVFQLILNPAIAPLDMIRHDAGNLDEWKFKGRAVTEPQTRRFKLVRVGYSPNLDHVRRHLTMPGQRPANGQWREAFSLAFPTVDGDGPIGFPDASWVHPCGKAAFLLLGGSSGAWSSGSLWADVDLYADWRWMVEVVEE